MASAITTDAARQSAIKAAIREAERVAADDDRRFVEELRRRALGAGAPLTRGGRLRVVAGADRRAGDASLHIYEDPRFLANARALAAKTKNNLRIIGGRTVPTAEFRDCVAVGNDAQWGCTGTLIAPTVVLTAGHCARFATRVYVGTDVTKKGTIVRVRKRIRHPKYHKGGQRNDLMVLILDDKVPGVAPRKIASARDIDEATDGRVVGFGNVEQTGNYGYGLKRFVDVPIASPRCDGTVNGEDDSSAYGCDEGLELIAGKPLLARDTCTGDSGGPFYIGSGRAWALAGATSRATDSATHACGDGGVYVRVDKYWPWIRSVADGAL